MLHFRGFRPLFRAFYPHPAHKSALRAEAATHRPAPGKPGWPPSSTWPLFSRPTPHAPRPNSGVRSCADPPLLATACHRHPNWQRSNGARSQRAAPYASMSPNRAIVQKKSRLLAEFHRDWLYPMMGKDAWVAGADRREAPGPKPVRLGRRLRLRRHPPGSGHLLNGGVPRGVSKKNCFP